MNPLAFLMLVPLAFADVPATADSRKYFYEDILEPFFRPDPRDPAFMRAVRPGSTAEPFQMPKPDGIYRIFILGGSIAQSYQGDSLQRALHDAFPGKSVEAINCGMGAYDSHRELLLIEELLGYEPDALVLLTGHNESVGAAPVSRRRLRLARLREAIGLGPRLAPPKPSADPDAQAAAENAQRDAALSANLSKILAAARAKGVEVVVAAPPLNYRDAPSRTAEPLTDLGFVAGWAEYLRGNSAAAAARWREALSRSPRPRVKTALLFYLGRLAEDGGRHAEAADLFRQALDADPLGAQGATPKRLDLLRGAAKEGGGRTADLDAAFIRAASPRMPGLVEFYDGVHWREEKHPLVSVELAGALSAKVGDPGAPWPDDAQKGDKRHIDLLYALSDIALRGDRFSWRAAHVLERLAAKAPDAYADPQSIRAMAAKAEPHEKRSWRTPKPLVPDAALTWYLGELALRRRQWKPAAALFAKAAADGGFAEARLHEALALSLAGEADAARAALQKAERARPFEARGVACGLGLRADCSSALPALK